MISLNDLRKIFRPKIISAMSNPTSPKKTAEGTKVTATLSTSTSSFEALDPHDPQLNHLASLMFSKSAEWMQVCMETFLCSPIHVHVFATSNIAVLFEATLNMISK